MNTNLEQVLAPLLHGGVVHGVSINEFEDHLKRLGLRCDLLDVLAVGLEHPFKVKHRFEVGGPRAEYCAVCGEGEVADVDGDVGGLAGGHQGGEETV